MHCEATYMQVTNPLLRNIALLKCESFIHNIASSSKKYYPERNTHRLNTIYKVENGSEQAKQYEWILI